MGREMRVKFWSQFSICVHLSNLWFNSHSFGFSAFFLRGYVANCRRASTIQIIPSVSSPQ